jgi:superfamily II RNA helicase
MGSQELLMTEMILGGVFNKLDAAETAALLSSLVFQQKSSKDDRGSDPRDLAPTDALKEVLYRGVFVGLAIFNIHCFFFRP